MSNGRGDRAVRGDGTLTSGDSWPTLKTEGDRRPMRRLLSGDASAVPASSRRAPRRNVMRRAAFLLFILAASAHRPGSSAQLLPEVVANRTSWENFLERAAVVGADQLSIEEGVTEPWKLTLKQGDVTRHALWKNPRGTQWGYLESWKYEIAAYRLDKLLGLDMVPPTVEKRFRGRPGSCQLWIEDTEVLLTKVEEGLDPQVLETTNWKLMGYMQQLFDNLIGNEDRHMGNVLISSDDRSILIDQSRTFRTTPDFTEKIPFCAAAFGGPRPCGCCPGPSSTRSGPWTRMRSARL